MKKLFNIRSVCFSMVLCCLIMFVLNALTYYATDDYAYMYSFFDYSKIENIVDILLSLYGHYFSMNGRLVAHFFTHLFLMFPPIIFDIVNAMFYSVMVFFILKLCDIKCRNQILAYWIINGLIWLLMPVYGQVFLWLDGSCNYLWGNLYLLIYIYPIISLLRKENVLNKRWKKILYVLGGLIAGAWIEAAAFACLTIESFVIFYNIIRKRKVYVWQIFSLVFTMFGLFIMMVSPGNINNKLSESDLESYIGHIYNASIMYVQCFGILFLGYLLLFILTWRKKVGKEKLGLSFFFVVVSLIANYIHSFADYYPERCMITSLLFLVLAFVTLFFSLYKDIKDRLITKCLLTFFFVMYLIQFVVGGIDIGNTYIQCMNRDMYIEEQKENGNMNLKLELISPNTKYSAKYGLRDLAVGVSKDWPNNSMSKYYGVDSIQGVYNVSEY